MQANYRHKVLYNFFYRKEGKLNWQLQKLADNHFEIIPYLNINIFRWLDVQCKVKAFTFPKRSHVGGQVLIVVSKPLNLK